MKTYLFLIPILLFALNVKSQDPDPRLFNQLWYLYRVEDSKTGQRVIVEEYQPYLDMEIPQIEPFLIIDAALNFNGLGICNTFDGTLEYNTSENSFRTTTSNVTENSCGFLEDFDEPFIIGPFGFISNDSSYKIISLTITDDDDGFQTLTYATQPFIGYTYRNTPVLSNERFKKKFFSLYPNPTSDVVYFSSENTAIESMVLYDSNGAKISKIEMVNNTIDITSLATGVYFIEITSLLGKETHQIIKK